MAGADETVVIPPQYQEPEGLRTLANYLRSQNGVKVRSGIEHDKRVDYFKGKKLVESILEAKKWPKSIPAITNRDVAIAVGNLLCASQFFHRSEKIEGKKSVLAISKRNVFDEAGYYTWMYAGNMVWSNIATGLVIAIVIGFTLLPIWPDAAKKMLWYLSVTFLIAVIAFCLIRFLLFMFMWLIGYDFWIFPRLFDESLSVQDSFKPVISFTAGSTGQGYYRVGVLLCLGGFGYWAMTQPTEFDEFLKAQKGFIDDIYAGNLLTDVSQEAKDSIDRHRKSVPSVEDWLREMAEEERLESPSTTTSSSTTSSSHYDEDTLEESTSSGSQSRGNHEAEQDSSGNSFQSKTPSHANGNDDGDEGLNEEEFNDQMLEDILNGDFEEDA